MRDAQLTLSPLSGATLQVSLLAPALLVFLLLFVAAPVSSHRSSYGLDPPHIPSSALREVPETGLLISLPRDGTVFIDARSFTPAEFAAVLQRCGHDLPPTSISIRADRSLPFSAIRQALRGVQLSRAGRVYLVTFEGQPIELLFPGAT